MRRRGKRRAYRRGSQVGCAAESDLAVDLEAEALGVEQQLDADGQPSRAGQHVAGFDVGKRQVELDRYGDQTEHIDVAAQAQMSLDHEPTGPHRQIDADEQVDAALDHDEVELGDATELQRRLDDQVAAVRAVSAKNPVPPKIETLIWKGLSRCDRANCTATGLPSTKGSDTDDDSARFSMVMAPSGAEGIGMP